MIRDKSRLGWWALVMMGWLAALMPAMGRTAEYTIGPAPAWVVPTAPGVASPDEINQGSYGEVYLLADMQVLAGDQQRVTYHRLVTSAINASGVSAVANVEISFDPSYQTLVLHSINIVRHGHVIPKLSTARIQVLQRETGLEARIYDGAKTVNVDANTVFKTVNAAGTAPATAALSDLKAGSRIVIYAAKPAQGETATASVVLILPAVQKPGTDSGL